MFRPAIHLLVCMVLKRLHFLVRLRSDSWPGRSHTPGVGPVPPDVVRPSQMGVGLAFFCDAVVYHNG